MNNEEAVRALVQFGRVTHLNESVDKAYYGYPYSAHERRMPVVAPEQGANVGSCSVSGYATWTRPAAGYRWRRRARRSADASRWVRRRARRASGRSTA